MTWIWKNKLYLFLAAVILYLAAARFTSDRAKAKEDAAREKAFQETALKLGAAIARERTADELSKELSEKNAQLVAALKDKSKDSHVIEHTTDTVTIHDTVTVHDAGAQTWEDSEGRFHLDLAKGLLHRDERFRLDGVVVEGPDGRTKVRGVSLTEISPRTGLPLPSEGVQIDSHFDVVRETPPIGMFHPRAVAALGSGGYGLGLEVLNLHDRFDLNAVALYAPGPKSVRLGPAVTWRVKLPFLDTNLGIGPSFLYDVRRGTWSAGAVATIELTR